MKSASSKSVESVLTIPVPEGGVTEHQLLHYLRRLVDVTMAPSTDTWKSVQTDAPSLRLSITVSATGEPPTRELSTSTQQPGDSSQIDQSDSSRSPSDLPSDEVQNLDALQHELKRSRTPGWNFEDYQIFCDHMGELMLGDKQLTMWGAAYLTHVWMNRHADE